MISILDKNNKKASILSLKDDNINYSATQKNNNIALNANDKSLNQSVFIEQNQDLQVIARFLNQEYYKALRCGDLEKIAQSKKKFEIMIKKASKEHESFFKSFDHNNGFDIFQMQFDYNNAIQIAIIYNDFDAIRKIEPEYSKALNDGDLEKMLEAKKKFDIMIKKASKEHELFFKSSGQDNEFERINNQFNQEYNLHISVIADELFCKKISQDVRDKYDEYYVAFKANDESKMLDLKAQILEIINHAIEHQNQSNFIDLKALYTLYADDITLSKHCELLDLIEQIKKDLKELNNQDATASLAKSSLKENAHKIIDLQLQDYLAKSKYIHFDKEMISQVENDIQSIQQMLNQSDNLLEFFVESGAIYESYKDFSHEKMPDNSINHANSFAHKLIKNTVDEEEDDIINNDEEDQSQGTTVVYSEVDSQDETVDVVGQ